MKKIIIAIISLIVIVLLVDLFVYKNKNIYKEKEIELENSIGTNVYEVISVNKAIKVIDEESGILLLTDDDNIEYAKTLNDLARDLNVDKIYYVDLTSNTDDSKLISVLENNVEINNEKYIIVPVIVTVNEGTLTNIHHLYDYSGYKLDKKIISILSNYKNNKDIKEK